jgi:hypothetical protein
MQLILKELGIESVEIRTALVPSDYASPPDAHWNDTGHAKAAEKLKVAIGKSAEPRERLDAIATTSLESPGLE